MKGLLTPNHYMDYKDLEEYTRANPVIGRRSSIRHYRLRRIDNIVDDYDVLLINFPDTALYEIINKLLIDYDFNQEIGVLEPEDSKPFLIEIICKDRS